MLILDGNMPEMDGYECAKNVREYEEANKQPPTYILCLSGEDAQYLKMKTQTAGINDYCMHIYIYI